MATGCAMEWGGLHVLGLLSNLDVRLTSCIWFIAIHFLGAKNSYTRVIKDWVLSIKGQFSFGSPLGL